ncbi:hypothetical protein [uncultured Negativibacillus sp.]|nr:hypothetical protein [uncultured Negativibacillus sp.]
MAEKLSVQIYNSVKQEIESGTTEVEFEVSAQELAKLSPQEIARTAQ